ncbi:hypothetical protein [Hansschlegelia sp.]|uniref:hypothetical protein n=1 Tax=Hansschlegelia sp. TaxID=2041892 RepID=UPI002BF549D3|nr:hypothetical protein [Hansschlegelia sp.]HVI28859.1 hypothetical protein [Hansschlegelia sp.]
MAIMRIGGRTVLVDTADFACTSGSEQVCMHFDGRLTIEPAWAETFMKSAPERTALGAFKVVQPGIRERPYVRVIGRVVGERGLAL